MQENDDIYARYHDTPGDTSQGFWISALLTVIGACICALDIFLYTRFRESLAVMIPICVFNTVYLYFELNFWFIRKYYFRYHRRLGLVLWMSLYFIASFAAVSLAYSFVPGLVLDAYCAFIPFFFAPAIFIVLPVFVLAVLLLAYG